MTLFLLVTDTASSSSFMNCLLSSLHFILWDLMTPSGGVLNIWRDIKPLDCSLWPSKLFAINFNSFEYVFLLPCWSSLPFSFPTQLCIPISPDSVNPMFQGHCTWWGHILLSVSQPGPTEKWGPRRRVQIPRPLLEGGRKHSPWTWDYMSAKKRGPVLRLHLKSPQDGPSQQSTHAAVGITHISQGIHAGKARTHHSSDEAKVWVSSQEKILFRLRSFKHSL